MCPVILSWLTPSRKSAQSRSFFFSFEFTWEKTTTNPSRNFTHGEFLLKIDIVHPKRRRRSLGSLPEAQHLLSGEPERVLYSFILFFSVSHHSWACEGKVDDCEKKVIVPPPLLSSINGNICRVLFSNPFKDRSNETPSIFDGAWWPCWFHCFVLVVLVVSVIRHTAGDSHPTDTIFQKHCPKQTAQQPVLILKRPLEERKKRATFVSSIRIDWFWRKIIISQSEWWYELFVLSPYHNWCGVSFVRRVRRGVSPEDDVTSS